MKRKSIKRSHVTNDPWVQLRTERARVVRKVKRVVLPKPPKEEVPHEEVPHEE